MSSTAIFAGRAQDEAPHDPALATPRLLLHTLPDFLDCFDDIALFEFSEGPVHVSIVTLPVEFFGLAADIQCLRVDHVDIEQESQVVVCIRVLVVQDDALFEVLHGVLVVTYLEVGEAEVVVQLGIVLVDALRLFKGCNREHITALFVHGDTVVEECLPRTCSRFLYMRFACHCQPVPVLLKEQAEADLLKVELFFVIDLSALTLDIITLHVTALHVFLVVFFSFFIFTRADHLLLRLLLVVTATTRSYVLFIFQVS